MLLLKYKYLFIYVYIYRSYIIYILFTIYYSSKEMMFNFLVEEKKIISIMYMDYSFEREFIYIEFHWGMVLGFQIKLPICSKHSPTTASSGFRF